MPKRVLITGSAGFVGSHLVDHLLENTDWEIIGLDSFKHRGDSLRVCKDPRYQIITCDLSTPISKRVSDQIGQIDYLINAASESHVDRSIQDPIPFVQNNINLMLYILEFALNQKNLQKFIQVSTDEVYGSAPEGVDFKEWSMILPSNPYSASKASQECIAISYWRTYGLPLIITNTMNMFGERQDPEKYIPLLISKISKNEKVQIHYNEKMDYIGKRHYLHARVFADSILFLLNNIDPLRYFSFYNYIQVPSRYNITGQKELNNLSIALIIANFMGKDLDYELVDFHSTRPGHDLRYSLDGSLIENCSWKPSGPFEEHLKKTVQWTLDNPEWMK